MSPRKPNSDLAAMMVSEVPTATRSGRRANTTSAGTMAKPPPAPTTPVSTPMTVPSSAISGMLTLTGAATAVSACGRGASGASRSPPAPPLPITSTAKRGRTIIDRAPSPMITANSTRMNSSLLTSIPATVPSCCGIAGTSQRRVQYTTSSEGMEKATAARTCTKPRRQ